MESGSEQLNKDNQGDMHMVNDQITDQVEEPDPESLKNSVVCLIRHATTQWNVEFQQMGKTHGFEGEEYRKLKIRNDLIDPPINDMGLAQCQNGSKYIK